MEKSSCGHIEFIFVWMYSMGGKKLSPQKIVTKSINFLNHSCMRMLYKSWTACNNISVSLSLLHRPPCYQQSTRLASCRPTSWFVRWWPGTRMSSPTVISWCISTTSCTRALLAPTRYDQQMAPVRLPVVLLFSTRWRTSQTHVMYVDRSHLNTEKQSLAVTSTAISFFRYFLITQWFNFTCQLLVLFRKTLCLTASMKPLEVIGINLRSVTDRNEDMGHIGALQFMIVEAQFWKVPANQWWWRMLLCFGIFRLH